MAKKNDLPAMPFYFGDWRKAPEIRALDLDVRMIWFEMMGFMWESTERGYLTINGKPVSNSVITRVIGCDITEFEKALQQLEEFNVFSRREDGAINSSKNIGKKLFGENWDQINATYGEFKKMRTRTKKPMTELAEKRMIEKLKKLSSDNIQLAINILEQSIIKCWSDLYPLKEESGKIKAEMN